MSRRWQPISCLVALAAALCAFAIRVGADAPGAERVLGTWAGTMTHEGDTQAVALTIESGDNDRVVLRLSIPAIHLDHVPIGRAPLVVREDSVRIGSFALAWGDGGRTLRGVMPAGLVPVYAIPMELHRVARFDLPVRPALAAPERAPRWSYDAGAALWAGPTFAGGVVYAGGQDGMVHALEARGGTPRWTFHAGGAIRVRPVIARGALYVQADDGLLYALDAAKGTLRWKTKIVESPIERLPFSNPKSRYDRFGSDVTVANDRLFIGTHDGRLLAIDPADGRVAWAFQAGDAILAAPAVASGRVLFGGFDHCVYALDATRGTLQWKTDTKGAVVSTPAVAGAVAVVGNRAYDLLGLDVETGRVVWKRYIWSSWVESSATLFAGLAYVGSSDEAAVYAVDPRDGRILWQADVFGWAWGQPAVTKARVYEGASSQVGYAADHLGGLFALNRKSGAVEWHYAAAAPDTGAYGFPGSPAVGAGLVFATTLDGRVLAFEP
jgi:eukaryotic-like serine/threonine-protein kinase